MSTLLTLAFLLDPAHAATRTAVATRLCPEDAATATPAGGNWSNLLQNSGRLVAGAVRDTSGLELARPPDWTPRENVLTWNVECGVSDARLTAQLEDAGVRQILVLSHGSGSVVVGQVVDGRRLAEWSVLPPEARTVEAVGPFEAALGETVARVAEPPVSVHVAVIDAAGHLVDGARIEIPGIALSDGPELHLPLAPGSYPVVLRADHTWMPGNAELTVVAGMGPTQLKMTRKAHLTLDIPKRATALVDGHELTGPGSAWVTPDKPLTVVMRKGQRQTSKSVRLDAGEAEEVKIRFGM